MVVSQANDAPTFAVGDGKLLNILGLSTSIPYDMVVQPDGKIIVTGNTRLESSLKNVALARYNVDGSLDTSFSGNGFLSSKIETLDGYGQSVALQADGKIVVGGWEATVSPFSFLLARFNSDGSIDTSFSGDGQVTVDPASIQNVGNHIAIQADGKILITGEAYNGSRGSFALARFNSDGSVDTSFSSDGKVTTTIATYSDKSNVVAVQADGKIVVAGNAREINSNKQMALVRYNSNGTLDTSFGSGGKARITFGSSSDVYSMAIQDDGKIVVGGLTNSSSTNYYALARFNTNGTLDTSFSGDGLIRTNVIGSYINSIVLQPDGKILVTGTTHSGLGLDDDDFGLMRYNSDGTLDTSFSDDGMLVTDFEQGNTISNSFKVSLLSDGKILVAGRQGINVGLTRYNSDGSYDTNFGRVSTLDGNPTFVEDGAAVVLDTDAVIVDDQLSALDNFNGATLTLARNGGADAQDQFWASGTLVSLAQGTNNLVVGSTTIGSVTQNSGGILQLSFNSNASNALVNEAMQQIAYSNSSDAPPASVQIDWMFDDGNTGEQGPGGALSVTGSTTIDISAINDDPVNSGSLPTDIMVTEDVLSDVNLSLIELADVDAGNSELTLTLSTAAGGEIVAAAGSGITIGGSNTALSISGTVTQLNNYLSVASHIQYQHGVANTYGDNADTIQISVTDNGNAGVGGGTQIPLGTVSVDIQEINDEPVNSGSLPTDITVTEDVLSDVNLSLIDLDDVDAGSNTLTLTLSTATGGEIVAAPASGITVGGTSTALSISGTLTELDNYLNVASHIQYLHGVAHINGDNADTIQISITDPGDAGVGGASEIDFGTLNVDISAVDDDPENSGSLPTSITVTEDALSDVDLSLIELSDTDAQSNLLTLNLSTATGGELVAAVGSGITLGGTSTALSISGTVAQLNSYLSSASSIQYLHGVADTNGDLADTIQVNITDSGNVGGGAVIQLGTVGVDIAQTNDNPANSGSLPTELTGTEDELSDVNLSLIDLIDVDAGSSELTLTLSTATGGEIVAAAGTGITLGGTSTALSISASVTDLNNYLNIASHIQYLHGVAHTNGDNVDSIQISLTDNVDEGGGITEVDLGTVNIDIGAINDDPVNAGSLPTDIAVTEDILSEVDLSLIDLNDVDSNGASLTLTLNTAAGGELVAAAGSGITLGGISTALSISGSVTDLNNYLANASHIQYLHNENHANGENADTIQISVTDNGSTGMGGGGEIDLGTVSVDIGAVNDDPFNSGSLPTDIAVTEDVLGDVNLSLIDLNDLDANGNSLTLTLNTASGGEIVAAAGSGITVGGTSTARSISGTVTDLNDYLNTASHIQYLHGVAHTYGENADTIQISVTDNGNMGSGGGTEIDLGTVSVDIAETNDDPFNYGSLSTDIAVTEDVLSDVDLSLIDLGDVDAGSSSLTLTLSTATGGEIVAAVGSGITLGGTSTALSISGTLQDLNSYLDTVSHIQYLHGVAHINGDNVDTIQISITDNASGGGGTAVDLGSVSVGIGAINDDPVNGGLLPTTITVTEDVLSDVDLSLIGLNDVDSDSNSLTLTLSTLTGGEIVAAAGSGITFGGVSSALSISGSLTELNSYLSNPSHIQYLHSVVNTNGVNADTIQVSVTDNGNVGAGGGAEIQLGTVSVDIEQINDDPVNSGSLPTDIGVIEDVLSDVNLALIDLNDVDAEGNSITLTLNTAAGGNLVAAAGSGITVGGTSTALSISGSVTDLNSYLNTASHIQYQHDVANTNGDNVDTIQINVTDNGNVGAGGGSQITLGTVNVDIGAANDDPINSGSLPTTMTLTEDVLGDVDLSLIDLNDVDANGNSLTLTLSTATGGEIVAAAGSGITVGGISSALSISGSVTDLNTYLNTASHIQYLHGVADTNGVNADTIQVSVTDNGNVGVGGGTEIHLGTVGVDIVAINDDPVNIGSLPTDITVTEDVFSGVDLSLIELNDVDAEGNSLTLSLNTAAGGNLVATAGSGITVGGTSTALSISGSVTDLNSYLNTASHIQYQHDVVNTNGDNADTIQISVTDNGNVGAGGGSEITLGTVNVDIGAANDDPINSGSLPTAVTFTEDVLSDVDLMLLDLSDVDVGNGVLTLGLRTTTGGEIVAAAGSGITVGGISSALSISGTVTDLSYYLSNTSHIKYVHSVVNTNGVNADTIQVSVTDNGNVGAGGGTEIQLGTMRVDITEVNDAPVNSGSLPAVIAVTEDVPAEVNLSLIDLTDDDSGVLTLTLNTTTGGEIVAAAGSGITVGGTSTALTLSGTVVELNSYLNVASNIQYLHGVANTHGDAADTIRISVTDDANSANGTNGSNGGSGEIQLGVINVDIAAVNDDPANSGSLPSVIVATEDVPSDVDLSLIDIIDVDAGSSVLTLTLSTATGGEIVAAAGSGITVGDSSRELTISGTVTDLNSYLSNASSVQYLHSVDQKYGDNADAIQISLTDNSIGSGGDSATIDLGTITVNIDGVKDEPIVNEPLGTLQVIENTVLPIHNQGFSLSDLDFDGSIVNALLSVSDGSIEIDPGDSDVSIVSGNGTDSVIFSGTVEQLNSLLSGSSTGTVNYFNRSENPQEYSSITLYVDNSGTSAGINVDSFSELNSASQLINATSVNDSPDIESHGGLDSTSLSTPEGEVSVTTVEATDPDVGDTVSYSIIDSDDAELFSIDTVSGVLSFTEAPDFENPHDSDNDGIYEVRVQATDSEGASDAQSISVYVENISESPTAISLSSSAVDEYVDSTEGVVVGALTAIDSDVVGTFQYAIVGGVDAAYFSIGGEALDQLILTDGVLDGNRKQSYSVLVKATDVDGLSVVENIIITINDVIQPVAVSGYSERIVVEDVDADNSTKISAMGDLVVVDSGGERIHFAPDIISGEYGTLSIDTSGQWEYSSDIYQEKIQALGEGEIAVETLIVTSEQGLPHTVTVSIEGKDDPATLEGKISGEIEAGRSLSAMGDISILDVDTSDNPIWLPDQSGTQSEYGLGEFSVIDNQWVYQLDSEHSRFLELEPEEVLYDGFWITASDGSRHWVSIKIVGDEFSGTDLYGATTVPDEAEDLSITLPVTVSDVFVNGSESGNTVELEKSEEGANASHELDAHEEHLTEDESITIAYLEPISVDMDSSMLSMSRVSVASKDTVGMQEDDASDRITTVSNFQTLKLIWDDEKQANELLLIEKSKTQAHKNAQELSDKFLDMENSVVQSQSVIAQVSAGLGLTVAVGYVTWALQAGSMLASFFVSMPVWRQFDPLPILAKKQEKNTDIEMDIENKPNEDKQRSEG